MIPVRLYVVKMALYDGFPDTLLVFVFAFTAQEHVMLLADIFESYIYILLTQT